MINWQPGVTLEEMEKEVIMKALQFFHGNKTHTANALGISIRTIQNKLSQYAEQEEKKLAKKNEVKTA